MRRQPQGRAARSRAGRADGVSPAAVNNADQLPFFTVVPDGQSHLAQRPGGGLQGAVGRRRQGWERAVPREPAAHPAHSRPLTCHRVAGAAAALALRGRYAGGPPRAPGLRSERRSCGCGLPLPSAATPGSGQARAVSSPWLREHGPWSPSPLGPSHPGTHPKLCPQEHLPLTTVKCEPAVQAELVSRE